MNNEMKEEFQNIEIPKELHTRVGLAVSQYKKNRKKPQKFPKWIIASVASSNFRINLDIWGFLYLSRN